MSMSDAAGVRRKAEELGIEHAGKDDAVVCSPIKAMTLERALSFVRDDEVVEVTPKSIRLRKIILSALKRKTARYGGAKKK